MPLFKVIYETIVEVEALVEAEDEAEAYDKMMDNDVTLLSESDSSYPTLLTIEELEGPDE